MRRVFYLSRHFATKRNSAYLHCFGRPFHCFQGGETGRLREARAADDHQRANNLRTHSMADRSTAGSDESLRYGRALAKPTTRSFS